MVQIRDARVDDAAGIARVQVDSYRTAYAPLLPAEYLAQFSYEEQTQDWVDLIHQTSDLLLAAVDDAGQVLGYALSRRTPDPAVNYDCELAALHVRKDHHHQGIGRRLMAETARQMQAAGCRSLGLWVMDGNPAVGFYEHLGGEPNGEQFFEIEELNLRKREIGYRWGHIDDLIGNK